MRRGSSTNTDPLVASGLVEAERQVEQRDRIADVGVRQDPVERHLGSVLKASGDRVGDDPARSLPLAISHIRVRKHATYRGQPMPQAPSSWANAERLIAPVCSVRPDPSPAAAAQHPAAAQAGPHPGDDDRRAEHDLRRG